MLKHCSGTLTLPGTFGLLCQTSHFVKLSLPNIFPLAYQDRPEKDQSRDFRVTDELVGVNSSVLHCFGLNNSVHW